MKNVSGKNIASMVFGVLGAVLLIIAALPGQSTAGSAQEVDDEVRVMTYNIRHAQGNDDCEDGGTPGATPEGAELEDTGEGTPESTPSAAQCGVDLERTTDVIASLEANIVALQEVDRFWDRSGGVDQPTELVESLDVNACFGANLSHEADGHADKPHQYGTLILSAYPILSCDNTFLPTAEGWEQRGLLEVRVEIDGLGEVAILNTHLQNDRDGEEDEAVRLRTEQAEAIAERTADLDVPVILMGDFNAEPDDEELASLRDPEFGLSVEEIVSSQDEESSTLQDAWQVAGDEDEDPEGYTYPASLDEDAERRIDVIFASSDFEVVSAEVPVDDDTLVASDHLPVVADLAPAEPREATPTADADVTPEPTVAADEAPATEPALIVAPTPTPMPEPVEEASPIQREEPAPTAPQTGEPEAQPTDEPEPTEELEPTEEPTAVVPEEPEPAPTEEAEPVEEAPPTEAPVPPAAPAPVPAEPAPTVEPAGGSTGEAPPAAAPPVEAPVEPAGEAPGQPAGQPQGPPVNVPPAAEPEPQGPPVEVPPANG